MRLTNYSVMGKFETALFAFTVLFACISLSESKRSACWRYGHSCWGGHGKRSGSVGGVNSMRYDESSLTGQHPNSQETTTRGGSRMFGMLDKTTGKFVPFPVLSLMLMRNRDSYVHPPIGLGLHDIPLQTITAGGQRLQIKSKRSDPDFGRSDAEDSISSQQEDYSASLDKSLSKESGSAKLETQESEDLTGMDESSSTGLSPDTSIFVRNRKMLKTNKSIESNSANEEDSQETNSSSQRQIQEQQQPSSHSRFFLK